MDGPIPLEIELGLVNPVKIGGVERRAATPALIFAAGFFMVGITQDSFAFYGLGLVLLYFFVMRIVTERDPHWFDIMIRNTWTYRWPRKLASAPGIHAPDVKIEPSVPVCGNGPL